MGRLNFMLAGKIDMHIQDMSLLKEILGGTGINAELSEKDGYAWLKFDYDYSAVGRKKTRNAGRREKMSASLLKVSEVLEMNKTMSEKEMLEKLQISRSTYYRRLRSIDENNLDFHF